MTDRIPDLSILVCAYNMARELPRTLQTLAATYQRGIEDIDLEVVVLDNGSMPAVDAHALQQLLPGVTVVRPDVVRRSPVIAINRTMAQLRGKVVGLWIDGARMASPGLLGRAMEAWRADPARAVGTLAFHLGPDVQMRSVAQGYDAAAEDALLDSVPWMRDGYALFDISVLAGSSAPGWFGCINETNGLFMDRALWAAIGGLDERFEAAGGGFCNLEFWERVVAHSGGHPWLILGEGTFHQVHGGAATNGTDEGRAAMAAEYAAIFGHPYSPPRYRPHYVGALDPARPEAGFPRASDPWRHVHSVRDRHFRVDLPVAALAKIQQGTLRTRYKNLRLAKNPFDLALYPQLLAALRPATIIEVGTSEGGSAAWLIDQCRVLGLPETRLLSIDIAPPELVLANVRFFSGDVRCPAESFPTREIAEAPHPWLVIEDSAHTYEGTCNVLGYFDDFLQAGDMLVVEDGVVADLEGDLYRNLQDGPNRAVAEFLGRTGDRYGIDQALCDFYGHNVTYAPNGWLRRMV